MKQRIHVYDAVMTARKCFVFVNGMKFQSLKRDFMDHLCQMDAIHGLNGESLDESDDDWYLERKDQNTYAGINRMKGINLVLMLDLERGWELTATSVAELIGPLD